MIRCGKCYQLRYESLMFKLWEMKSLHPFPSGNFYFQIPSLRFHTCTIINQYRHTGISSNRLQQDYCGWFVYNQLFKPSSSLKKTVSLIGCTVSLLPTITNSEKHDFTSMRTAACKNWWFTCNTTGWAKSSSQPPSPLLLLSNLFSSVLPDCLGWFNDHTQLDQDRGWCRNGKWEVQWS